MRRLQSSLFFPMQRICQLVSGKPVDFFLLDEMQPVWPRDMEEEPHDLVAFRVVGARSRYSTKVSAQKTSAGSCGPEP